MGWAELAIRYMLYHKVKSLILIACIFLTALLPIAIEILLSAFEKNIEARAAATPLVIGPRGSRFDLTLRSLYFRLNESEEVEMGDIEFGTVADVQDSGLAQAIPLHCKFSAGGFPVVGTSLGYFDFRRLEIESGQALARIGDAVIGAGVAAKLGIGHGDQLLTDIKSMVSLSSFPLKLQIAGVLGETGTADDNAIFVDLKTAWIIEGIGHGHQNVEDEPEDRLLSKGPDGIVASAAVLPHTEITDSNIDSFHFHGDDADFPVTSIIAVAPDEKSETILIGRYRDKSAAEQLVVPQDVIGELMRLVFQIKRFFDANAILIAVSTLLLLILIVMLSQKLRAREMQTMSKLGASHGTVTMLQVAEIGTVVAVGLLLVLAASFMIRHFASDIVQSLLVG